MPENLVISDDLIKHQYSLMRKKEQMKKEGFNPHRLRFHKEILDLCQRYHLDNEDGLSWKDIKEELYIVFTVAQHYAAEEEVDD